MKKFDPRIEVGTRVMLNHEWKIVSKVKMGRFLVELVGMAGSFRAGAFSKFTNRDLGKKDPHGV
jgi:hypothetical protein